MSHILVPNDKIKISPFIADEKIQYQLENVFVKHYAPNHMLAHQHEHFTEFVQTLIRSSTYTFDPIYMPSSRGSLDILSTASIMV